MGFYRFKNLKTNNNVIINIDNSITVSFLSHLNRVVFNMAHPIQTTDRETGKVITIADYKYVDFSNSEEYNLEVVKIENLLYAAGFLVSSNQKHHLVNPTKIDYITFQKDKLKIIFDFNFSTSRSDTMQLSNECVVWSYRSEKEYTDNLIQIEKDLL